MNEEEITDVDLDVVNLLKKLPTGDGYGHLYFNSKEDSVASVGGGDAFALMDGFLHLLQRKDNEGGEMMKDCMLGALLLYFKENKKERKEFKQLLKEFK